MSALMLLRGLSFSTRNICSSLSKEMKFPNQERFASLGERGIEAGGSGRREEINPLSSHWAPSLVELTRERILGSNWTSPQRWGLDREERESSQHILLFMALWVQTHLNRLTLTQEV